MLVLSLSMWDHETKPESLSLSPRTSLECYFLRVPI